MSAIAIHSRSILAGYDPERLGAAKVAVIGLGALGQNLVQNLALCGVGNLTLVDFDEFEDHNATRSPYYPTPEETAALGLAKTAVVGARVARVGTAVGGTRVWLVNDMVQLAGDAVIRWADVVVSAVDSIVARAWLAERCRVHGVPMVEGGFSGPDFNFSGFGPEAEAPCYRCFNPTRESSASCRQYALEAEAVSIVPAIQTTAAVVGGLMAELVIQTLMGEFDYGRRVYGNIRTSVTRIAELQTDPNCPGRHDVLATVAKLEGRPHTVSELAVELADRFGEGYLCLPEPAVLVQTCTVCIRPCRVGSTESVWLRRPRCTECGGPWPPAPGEFPQTLTMIPFTGPLSELAAATKLHALGLRAGASCEILRDDTEALVLLPGPAESEWLQPAGGEGQIEG